MPQIFSTNGYRIYFWSDEGKPLESIHVHVSKGRPSGNSTKIWITQKGGTVVCNNKSEIPIEDLRDIRKLIEARCDNIIMKWQEIFREVKFYC